MIGEAAGGNVESGRDSAIDLPGWFFDGTTRSYRELLSRKRPGPFERRCEVVSEEGEFEDTLTNSRVVAMRLDISAQR